jgi:polysaccharide biosynthesis protein PslG
VPGGFFGTVIDGPMVESGFGLSGETSQMARSGVESVRFSVDWHNTQPYASFSQVPAGQKGRFRDEGGVPTYWFDSDRLVRAAAQRGLRPMLTVLFPPSWGSVYPGRKHSPPVAESYARFLALLVRRYGPHGTFWTENPGLRKVPVRDWQLLNEVNHSFYWNVPGSDPNSIDNTSSAPGYVNLLRITRPAIKAVDPHARIVHAGTDSKSWRYVRAIYRAGGRRLFDAFAVHPFTDGPNNVINILRFVRREMNRAGDRRKPIMVSEWSWPSAKGHAPDPGNLSRTSRGQARAITQTQKLFVRWRRRLRLSRAYYYNWLSEPRSGIRFTFAGLRNLKGNTVSRKRAQTAYARSSLAYEGCRKKSSRSATRCLRRRR